MRVALKSKFPPVLSVICIVFIMTSICDRVSAGAAPGSLDSNFSPAEIDGLVRDMLLLHDGRILIGGWFTHINGISRSRIARLNSDGSLDTGFNAFGSGTPLGTAGGFAEQPDHKVLIVDNRYDSYLTIYRLNEDGSLDATFDTAKGYYNYGRLPGWSILTVLPSGKILVDNHLEYGIGAPFSTELYWLNSDGSIYLNSVPGFESLALELSPSLNAIIIQPDWKIILGGHFYFYSYHGAQAIVRLLPDGSFDSSFELGTNVLNNDAQILTMARQEFDGKILIGGDFTAGDSPQRPNIARLNPDGSKDQSFNPGAGPNGIIYSINSHANGKILVAGAFTTVSGVVSKGIVRPNNDGSRDAGFTASVDRAVYTTCIQKTDGKILIGGGFTNVNGVRRTSLARIEGDGVPEAAISPQVMVNPGKQHVEAGSDVTFTIDQTTGTAPIFYQWRKDGRELTNQTNIKLQLKQVTLSDSGKYSVTASNIAGSVASPPAELKVSPFLLDTNFNARILGFCVLAIEMQTDGKILIGGSFTNVAGQNICGVARLNGDGSLDGSFRPVLRQDDIVSAVRFSKLDGDIIIAGNFTNVNGTLQNRIARLNADGSLDSSFKTGLGADDKIYGALLQNDGKIIIGGFFTNYNGTETRHIARLNSDGSLDQAFTDTARVSDAIYVTALQSDNKILIGGGFTNVNGININRIARLNQDGSLDTGFDTGTGANDSIWALSFQSDGKIMVGGSFTNFNGQTFYCAVRLNPNGSVDASIPTPSGANGAVYSVAVTPGQKILVGGEFYGGFAQLNADLRLDPDFISPNILGYFIQSIVIQPDGKTLLGGMFWKIHNVQQGYLARLNTDFTQQVRLNSGIAEGRFQLQLMDQVSVQYQIQTSTNLLDWDAWTLAPGPNTWLQDSNTPLWPYKFYRAIKAP